MLVVTCPHCRSAVLQNADGTCPACGKTIPPEAMQPVVVQAYHGAPGGGRASPTSVAAGGAPQSGQHDMPDGAPYASAQHPIVQFQRQLLTNTPRVYMTQLMVAINVIVFVLMVLSGTSPFNPDGDTLIAWGANYGSKTLSGQWWRLLTCMYLHGGLLHIGFNMWILWDVGKQAERLTGNVGFLLMYILSGLFGSLASVYWNPAAFSVGASGAVFGVVGALFGFLLPRSDSVPKPFLASLKRSGFTFLAYNLIIGLAVPRIDMAAHIGGFVSGAILGLVMSQPLNQITAATRRIRNLAALALGMLGLAAAFWMAPQAPADLHGSLAELSRIEQQIEATYDEALDQFGRGQISEQEFTGVVESKVLQPWEAARAEFDLFDLNTLPVEQKEAGIKLGEYLGQREQQWRAVAAAVADLTRHSEFEVKAVEFCNDGVRSVKNGELSEAQLAEAIETRILPPWRSLRERLEQHDFADLPEGVQHMAARRVEYLRLREEAWNNLIVALKIHDDDMFRKYQERNAAAEKIAE